jgi:hypothetical protein
MMLQKRLQHLQKSWIACLVSMVLLAGWLFSIGFSFASPQILCVLVLMPIVFAFWDADLIFSGKNNWLKTEGVRKFAVALASALLVVPFIINGYLDLFHTDTLHYLIYYCIGALWAVLLFRAAFKK